MSSMVGRCGDDDPDDNKLAYELEDGCEESTDANSRKTRWRKPPKRCVHHKGAQESMGPVVIALVPPGQPLGVLRVDDIEKREEERAYVDRMWNAKSTAESAATKPQLVPSTVLGPL